VSTAPTPPAASQADLETAVRVRIAETGAVWYRVEGGTYDRMWILGDHPALPRRGYIVTSQLPYQGTVIVEERI
jgi:hypothetical protein